MYVLAEHSRGLRIMRNDKKSIMVVGQVPPPWGGQAVAIRKLVDTTFDGIDLHHVPMSFSKDMDDIGRFRWRKLSQLPNLIARIWVARFRSKCSTLYYPPGGESSTAVLRDIVVLLSCRMLFAEVIFHAHAGGFVDVAEATPLPIRLLARAAYRKPDVLIQLTEKSPPDGLRVGAKRIECVSNGLHDDGARYARYIGEKTADGHVQLLFVGAISAGKGIMVLLEACSLLKDRGMKFLLKVMGRFSSSEFEDQCASFIRERELEAYVEFIGVLTGDDKWQVYCDSDIFCFPSFFRSENQPLVIIEAMQFGLSVVASDWRGIPTMVTDGEVGFTVPIKDPEALAERLRLLIDCPELRIEMGRAARQVFLNKYTDAIWQPAMQAALRSE